MTVFFFIFFYSDLSGGLQREEWKLLQTWRVHVSMNNYPTQRRNNRWLFYRKRIEGILEFCKSHLNGVDKSCSGLSITVRPRLSSNIIHQTDRSFRYFSTGIYLNNFLSDRIYSVGLAASHIDLLASHVPSCHHPVSLTQLLWSPATADDSHTLPLCASDFLTIPVLPSVLFADLSQPTPSQIEVKLI